MWCFTSLYVCFVAFIVTLYFPSGFHYWLLTRDGWFAKWLTRCDQYVNHDHLACFQDVFSEKSHHISDHLLRPNISSLSYLVIILHVGCYLAKVKRKKCLHARVADHSVTLQAKYFTSQIEKKCFQIWQINVLGNETIVLALVESIAKITTVFLKELSSTLLYPFLKPGVYVGKHAHKSSWIN